MSFTPSGRNNPCPMCDRTHDGDCRVTDQGMVLCHTQLNGVPLGKRHPERPFIYCGHSDDAQGFGKWLPEHLDDPSKKAPRQQHAEPIYFNYCFWDGTPTPAQRYRKDTSKGKEVKWCRGGLQGRPQKDVAPYLWFETAQQRADGELLFIVKGELKAQQMTAAGFACISILDCSERLVTELRSVSSQAVIAPDCDLKDLQGWYSELSNQLPDARHLLPPMRGMDWRTPPDDGGLGLEDWLQRSKPDQHTILNTITVKPWKPSVDSELEQLGYSDLLDQTIDAIRAEELDQEMLARSELKTRYRVSDDRINTDLFKRLGESKVAKVRPSHGCVDLSKVPTLHYRQDGYVQIGDVGLLYGPYGSGKTTVALWKAYNGAQGKNILDRSQECKPYKTLIIATDSGLEPLNKSFDDLGINPDDPLLMPGHPDQMIHVWGYDPKQGHNSWICDIRGVIKLEQYVIEHGIEYVVIDSAKSVSSAAGWSYTSNEAVKALLKYIREAITKPLGCFIEFLSHDGTLKNAHSGAKAWAEDPSMVCSLDPQKDEETGQKTIEITFMKDRAAPSGQGLRQFRYYIEDCELKVVDQVEVIGNCGDAILEVLWSAYQNGIESVRTHELLDEVFQRFKKTRKTAENSIPDLMQKGNQRMVRPRRGRYALSPAEIQRRTTSPNRDLYEMGGGLSKSLGMTDKTKPPCQSPEGEIGGNAKPPVIPQGETSGGCLIPVVATVLPIPPPICDGSIGQTDESNLPDWCPEL